MTSDKLRIALVVASVRPERQADALVDWLRESVSAHDWIDLDVVDLRDIDLPLAGMGGASPITDRMHDADGFILLTPEYNHSFPASLKNAIDWHYTEWRRKPVTFVSYGAGSGGIRAVEQLRLVLPELHSMTTRNAVAISAPWERMTDGGFVAGDSTEQALTATLDELHWWAVALQAARHLDAVPA